VSNDRQTVEVYDASGRQHLGEFDPWDGLQIGLADPTPRVETRAIARILGFHPDPGRFYYCVEPYEPPEDDGLQPDAAR
jgi:hypothetical protein